MQPETVVVLVVWCVLWGAFTAWLAGRRNRDPFSWFVLGAVGALAAMLAVGLAPEGQRVRYDAQTGRRIA